MVQEWLGLKFNMTVMTTADFKKKFKLKYGSRKEFLEAVEVECHVDKIDGSYIFSKGDKSFIVMDWEDFLSGKIE